jgi:hypothetical protein
MHAASGLDLDAEVDGPALPTFHKRMAPVSHGLPLRFIASIGFRFHSRSAFGLDDDAGVPPEPSIWSKIRLSALDACKE